MTLNYQNHLEDELYGCLWSIQKWSTEGHMQPTILIHQKFRFINYFVFPENFDISYILISRKFWFPEKFDYSKFLALNSNDSYPFLNHSGSWNFWMIPSRSRWTRFSRSQIESGKLISEFSLSSRVIKFLIFPMAQGNWVK